MSSVVDQQAGAGPPQSTQAATHAADRAAVLAVAAVALLYVIAQALVFSWSDYYLGRDEAIYLSQVTPGVEALDMAVHRTRGMSLLVAPIALWADSMLVLRGWMLLLGGLGIFLAFRPWVRSIGWAAPVAAFVFAAWWVNLFFGPQLYPNFFAALGAVAAGGHFVAYLRYEQRRDLVIVAIALAFTSLVRPLDAVLAAFGMWVGMLLFRRELFVRATVAMAIGGLIGVAPWLAEGWVRQDLMPWETPFVAEETGASGLEADNLAVYLNNTAGPFRCVGDCPEEALADGITMRIREQVILAGFLLASFLGLFGNPRRYPTQAFVIAGLSGTAVLAYYLTCDCAINLRYLEPFFGFLALMIGGGVVRGWHIAGNTPSVLRVVLRVVGVVLIAGWATYQALLAANGFEGGVGSRHRAYLLAQIVSEYADGEPCGVAAAVSDRQIHYFSGCLGVALNRSDSGHVQHFIGGTTSKWDLNLLSQAGYRIFAVGRPSNVPDSSPVWDWEVVDISSDVLGNYRLFIAPEGVEIESRYASGYSPEDAGPP